MKRKDNISILPNVSPDDENIKSKVAPGEEEGSQDGGSRHVYLMEDGKLIPFTAEEYTTSTLYEVIESFSVECRLVRPEDPSNLVFEGKKPSKKTVPIFVKKNGECVLLDSWDSLESRPEQLADAREVIGAVPVKQVFVLKRK